MAIMTFLTSLTVVLLIGILCSLAAKRFNLPNTLLLLVGGIAVGNLFYKGTQVVAFPAEFMIGMAIIALLMIVFDSAAEFKIKEVNAFSGKAIKLTLVFLAMNIVLLAAAAYMVTGLNLYLCIVFAALMGATDPDVVLSQLKGVKSRAVEILKIESIINTPLTVLLPFIILDMMRNIDVDFMSKFLEEVAPFLQQFVTGVGAGIIIGVIIFKLMAKHFSRIYSPLGIVVAALLSYVLAENLGGNGVLSVAVFGMVFANAEIREKFKLLEFESMLTTFLDIIVFVLIGLAVKIPLTLPFILKSLLLFMTYLLIRYGAVYITFKNSGYTAAEKGFMSLNMPKGIAVAVVAFTLAAYAFKGPSYMPGMKEMLDLVVAFMLYSIMLSSVMARHSGSLLQKPAAEGAIAAKKMDRSKEKRALNLKKTI